MREELDKKLVETYPELYANRHGDENYGEDAADYRNKTGMWSKDEG